MLIPSRAFKLFISVVRTLTLLCKILFSLCYLKLLFSQQAKHQQTGNKYSGINNSFDSLFLSIIHHNGPSTFQFDVQR